MHAMTFPLASALVLAASTAVWGPFAAGEPGPRCNAFQAAAADFDGDGTDEFAVACILQPNLVVGLRDGALTTLWTAEEAGDATQGVAWGDFDGDGDPDLAVANFGGPTRIYRNDGGTLSLHWSSVEAAESKDCEWGDLDGDGDPDLLVAGNGPDQLYWNEGGAFGRAEPVDFGGATDDLALADADGDGDLDVLASTSGTPVAKDLLLHNQDGIFEVAWESPQAQQGASAAWADFDGDGAPGFAIARPDGRDAVWLSRGGQRERGRRSHDATHGREVVAADLDADGDPDLIWGVEAPLEIWRNEGGAFPGTWTLGDEPTLVEALAVGDVDGDGAPDLLVGARDADRDWTPGELGGPALRLHRHAGGPWAYGGAGGGSDPAGEDPEPPPDDPEAIPYPTSSATDAPLERTLPPAARAVQALLLLLLLALVAGGLRAGTGADRRWMASVLAVVAALVVARLLLQPMQAYGGASSEYIEHAQRAELALSLQQHGFEGPLDTLRRWDDHVVSHPVGLHATGVAAGAVFGHRIGGVLWTGPFWLLLLAAGTAGVAWSVVARRDVALFAGGLTLLLPALHGAATRFHYDLPMTAALWAAAGAVAAFGRDRPVLAGVAGGLGLGLAAALKWTALPFGAVLWAALLLLHPRDRRHVAAVLGSAALGAALTLLYVSAAPTSFSATSLALNQEGGGELGPIAALLGTLAQGLTTQSPGRLLFYPLATAVAVLSPVLTLALLPLWARWNQARVPLLLIVAGQGSFLLLGVERPDERFLLTLAPALVVGAALGWNRLPRFRDRAPWAVLALAGLVGWWFHLPAPPSEPSTLLAPGPRHPAVFARGLFAGDSFERRGWSSFSSTPEGRLDEREALWTLLQDCGVPTFGLAEGVARSNDTWWLRYRSAVAALEGEGFDRPLEILRPWTVAGESFWYLDPDAMSDPSAWHEAAGFNPETFDPGLFEPGADLRDADLDLTTLRRLDPPLLVSRLPVDPSTPRPPEHLVGRVPLPDGGAVGLLARSADTCR